MNLTREIVIKDRNNSVEDLNDVENNAREIDDLIPEKNESIDLLSVLAIDLAVPGGGHYYINNLYSSILFAFLKVSGACSIYYYYNDWNYKRSLYYAAKRADEDIDPHHNLQFSDSDGKYRTVNDYKKRYDRAAQYITFAILTNITIYISSLIILYFKVQEINESSLPTFEVKYSFNELQNIKYGVVSIKYTYRF